MPTALVTGSPDRVPDVAIALKTAGFDILAAGAMSAEDAPDLDPGSVDCYVQLPDDDGPLPGGSALVRTRAVLGHEMQSRFDTGARFTPLLAPGASVVLVIGERGPDLPLPATRALAAVLAEAIERDCGRAGVRALVVAEDRTPEEIADLARHRSTETLPWWHYADVDPDLTFVDWRKSVLCLASLRN